MIKAVAIRHGEEGSTDNVTWRIPMPGGEAAPGAVVSGEGVLGSTTKDEQKKGRSSGTRGHRQAQHERAWSSLWPGQTRSARGE
jgi:hypothetical protein